MLFLQPSGLLTSSLDQNCTIQLKQQVCSESWQLATVVSQSLLNDPTESSNLVLTFFIRCGGHGIISAPAKAFVLQSTQVGLGNLKEVQIWAGPNNITHSKQVSQHYASQWRSTQNFTLLSKMQLTTGKKTVTKNMKLK